MRLPRPVRCASAFRSVRVRDPIQAIEACSRTLDLHGIVEKDLHSASLSSAGDDQREHPGKRESLGEG